jgi:hypothetical protein
VSNSLDLNEFPDFREVAAKRRELRGEARRLDHEAKDLQTRIYLNQNAEDDKLDGEAKALLVNGGLADHEPSAALHEQLNRARRRQEIVRRASVLNEEAYEEIKGRRAYELAERIRPRHREAVSAIGQALKALARANAAERAIQAELGRAGIPNSMLVPAMSFPGIGAIGDYSAPICRWFEFARDKGFAVDVGGED